MKTLENPLVQIERTPNPESIKFVCPKVLTNQTLDFPNIQDSVNSPLVYELFRFSFVKSVFIASNFITITKSEGVNWEEIIPILQEYISGALESGLEISKEENNIPKDYEGTEVEKKIQEILDTYIKPAVEQDGGAIHFDSFHEGVVKVILKGSCSGCPSSTLTLKAGIENLLKRMVPEVLQVDSVSL
jgi:Fe-S cluster biogenesis protein NfuA